MFKNGLILAVFCMLSAGMLAFVYDFTKSKIEQSAKIAYERSAREALGATEGKSVALSTTGYGGPIEMIVGVGLDGKVTGVKIVRQKETPGLGAKIVNDKFLKQFIGRSAVDRLEPKKDIDAITGATISSRAVCQGVKDALVRVKSGTN